MSSPAQNARPVPVKIATSSSSLSRNSRQASARPVRSSCPSAFMRSGRFMRTTITCPCRSVSTNPMITSYTDDKLRRVLAIVLALTLVLTATSAAANEIRIVTFNLLHGGPWSEWTGDDQQLERRFAIVAGELQRLKPDIVALQEA